MLKEFNLVLLRKWCWRLYVDQGRRVWFKVLTVKYEVEEGHTKSGGLQASLW